MAISNLNFLHYEQQLSHIGVHNMQRRGSGMDFNQLREYRRGDELRKIDWKASSRKRKLISREYQDERDQDVIFLMDSGRRMRSRDGELSHFDHCVNAMLLTSYIALMTGDAVGFMSYASEERWHPPVKGKQSINLLLNSLYDLHSSPDASDLLKAAELFMARHQKRALVILITNVRDEDGDDIHLAVKLLAKKHMVLVASLREDFLDDIDLSEQETSFEKALEYAGTQSYMSYRDAFFRSLKSSGVFVTDSIAPQMHIALINEYLAFKRSGLI